MEMNVQTSFFDRGTVLTQQEIYFIFKFKSLQKKNYTKRYKQTPVEQPESVTFEIQLSFS